MKTAFALMTSSEVAEAAGRGATVLLPMGTCEVNGPQLPVGYDYLLSAALAEQVALRTNSVWLPPIAYGVSEALGSFPGTVFVPHEVLAAQLDGVLRSLIRHGFDHIVLINNHSPNQYPAEYVCRAIRRDTGLLIASVFPGQLAMSLSKDLYADEPGAFGHGGEPSTSLMLHLQPDSVRLDLMAPAEIKAFQGLEVTSPSTARFGDSEVNLFLDLSELSEIGGWGDAGHASAKRGAAIFDRMVEYCSGFVRRFHEINTRT